MWRVRKIRVQPEACVAGPALAFVAAFGLCLILPASRFQKLNHARSVPSANFILRPAESRNELPPPHA